MVQRCSHLNIVWLGHLVQQLQSLLLQHVIWVLEAVNDSQLMLSSILGVDAHNARQPINAHIFQVVAAALQEGGNHFCRCKATAQISEQRDLAALDSFVRRTVKRPNLRL